MGEENSVVRSHYKCSGEYLLIKDIVGKEGLLTPLNKDYSSAKVRIGTIQSLKGMKADVMILCGIDGKLPGRSTANLFVGATLEKMMLQVIRHVEMRV